MIKRMIMQFSIALFLIMSQSALAGANGLLFNVSATGTPANVSITLCLNGKGPLSCQNYNVSALTLSISTAAPNHVYPFTGIKINTPGYILGNLGLDCTPNDNGYCLFSVSNSQAQTISLVDNSGLSITPTTLPQATINTFYSQTVTAIGGVSPYTYAVSAGLLPTGLSLNTSTGVISGTPTIDSTSDFTVSATDSNSPSTNTGSQVYSMVVSGPLTLTPTTLPAGTISTAYSQTITVDSIATPIHYSVTFGSLPSGLTLSSSTGVISGTPTTGGTYPFTITATDAGGNTGSRGYSVVIYLGALGNCSGGSTGYLSCTQNSGITGNYQATNYSGYTPGESLMLIVGSCPARGTRFQLNAPAYTETPLYPGSIVDSDVENLYNNTGANGSLVGCQVVLCQTNTCGVTTAPSQQITAR